MHDAVAAGGAEPRPQGRVVEQSLDGQRQRAGVVGRDEQPGLPVGADHLGERPAGRRDHRHPAGHRLDGREREAFVERGHHGHLRLAVEAG